MMSLTMIAIQVFDWAGPGVDAALTIPDPKALDIDWTRYQSWDVVELTQNYLNLFLHYTRHDAGSAGIFQRFRLLLHLRKCFRELARNE